MKIPSPLIGLKIKIEEKGFYKGSNKMVAATAKLIIALVVILAAMNPDNAGSFLKEVKDWSFTYFNAFYIYAVVFYILVCLIILIVPSFAKIKLGKENDKPEFSNFSWLSMMFGAGIGIGMLTYSAAEPVWHLASNPEIIKSKAEILAVLSTANIPIIEGADVFDLYQTNLAGGKIQSVDSIVMPNTLSAAVSAFKYSFLHWGIGAWATYTLAGISLAFFSYRRNLPLTIRSSLTPLFGKSLQGGFGNVIDIFAIIATLLGIAQTIGLGLSSFSSGLYNITGAQWLITTGESPEPTIASLLVCLMIIMFLSMLSAISGIGKGIKWLSNINMILSIVILLFFLIFGATVFALTMFGKGLFSYIVQLPAISLVTWDSQTELGAWQTGWSVFYWAWWIAFAPFVGVFLARVSKNRTLREFILGAVLVPSLISFVWFTFVGGTAIHLELSGVAEGKIASAGLTYQIYEIINILLSNGMMSTLVSLVIIILLFTFQVTSADSAILVINTISAGGETEKASNRHIIIWSILLTAIIAVLLIAGGLGAIQSAMIIGALPFSLILVLMGVSLLKALIRDYLRQK